MMKVRIDCCFNVHLLSIGLTSVLHLCSENAHQSPWNPVGRISKLGKMMLIDSDEPLYIPVTQDPVPKTEDELEDDAEMLLNVADSELRAQLMSASLLSDMESFKAANPKGKLDDFIRWYSPR